jgi:hypothetical protein
MHKMMSAGALGLLMAVPAAAGAAVDAAEVAELKQQVAALMRRIEELENRTIGAETAQAQQASETLALAAAAAKPVEWASRVKLKGDFRYRHESTEEDGLADRTRHRIRARLGVEAKVTDEVKAYLGIATGDPTDPRSTNATLGAGNNRKNIALDYAYVDWGAFEGATVSLGKMKYPFERIGDSMFYDGDVNPEGAALRYAAANGFFASGYGFWLSESASGADANLFGAQLGWAGAGGLKLAVTYNDYGALQYNTAGLAEVGGNSTFGAANSACTGSGVVPCYLYDYDILGVGAEYAFAVGAMPVRVWADYLENTAIDTLNQGYSLGFTLGEARDSGSWQLGLLYQDVEKDAQWGGILDSDFAGGTTQGRGIAARGSWVAARNVMLNLTYFDNVRDYDLASERDFRRLLLDFNFRF